MDLASFSVVDTTGDEKLVVSWNWSRAPSSDDVKEILQIVEPNDVERNAILKCIDTSHIYRAYIAKNNRTNGIDAISIATLLPKTNTLHIEDFALHPRIRGHGYSYKLWDTWLAFVVEIEKWVDSRNHAMSIEVYKQNIDIWAKVMGVEKNGWNVLPLTNVPIQWMSRNLTSSIDDVEKEWVAIQQSYNAHLGT